MPCSVNEEGGTRKFGFEGDRYMEYKLEDLFDLQMGKTPSRNNPEYWNTEDNKWISIADLSKCGKYIETTKEYLSDKAVCESGISQIPANTVVMSFKLSIGKTAITPEPMYSNEAIMAFRDKHVVDLLPDYLYYLLSSRDWSAETNKAVMGKTLNKATLSKIKVSIHDIEQQREIIDTLDKVSNIISARQQELKKLDDLVKSRFIELFGDQRANPFGWPQTTIGDCCTLKSGTSLPADKENEGGTIPYVKVGDMNYPGNEQYITTSSRFVTEQTAGAGIFPVGTVIFPKRGGAIGTNKKRLTTLPICADLNVMGVTAGNALKSQYLMAYFNMVDLGALDNGSSVPQINNKDIAPLAICLPPLAIQDQFAAFVEQTDKSKLAVQQGLQELEILKKSLMQQYFG